MILLKQLELWTGNLARIFMLEQRCHCALADLGVILQGDSRPTSKDGPGTIRLKEEILKLRKNRQATLTQMKQVGAEILDELTLEVLISGGPEPGSYLSWMPGEPCIAWWRRQAQCSSRRIQLTGLSPETSLPIQH
jgi:hypothetical protein